MPMATTEGRVSDGTSCRVAVERFNVVPARAFDLKPSDLEPQDQACSDQSDRGVCAAATDYCAGSEPNASRRSTHRPLPCPFCVLRSAQRMCAVSRGKVSVRLSVLRQPKRNGSSLAAPPAATPPWPTHASFEARMHWSAPVSAEPS